MPTKKRRHRKSTQPVDPMEEKKKKLLEVHPLTIEITAKVDNGPSITMTFQYRTKLKIVTVTSKSVVPSNITGAFFKIYLRDYFLNRLR